MRVVFLFVVLLACALMGWGFYTHPEPRQLAADYSQGAQALPAK
jgi:hypothetical protein